MHNRLLSTNTVYGASRVKTTEPTEKQLARLPKHAQTYIKELRLQRDNALECMRKLESEQTPTRIKAEDLKCLGEGTGATCVTRYFHACRLEITQRGVTLCVDGLWGDETDMALSWRPAGRGFPCGDISLIPVSHQKVKLSNLAYNEPEYERLVKQKGFADEREEA